MKNWWLIKKSQAWWFYLNNSRTKGDQEKGAYQRPKCKKQEKIANKGKMVLNKINKEVPKWKRLLGKKKKKKLNKTESMKHIVEQGDALHTKFEPIFQS